MALRSLDNALPTTPERPKKLPKFFVSAVRKPSGANDENRLPVPPVGDPAIDYISSKDLEPIPEPDIKFQSLMEGLESKDWMKGCESLNDVRRFAMYHSSLLLPILEKVTVIMVKSMKNPRSALIKTSIMTASDIFIAFGDNLLESSTSDAFDQLLLQLLLKASQDKRFVCEEADKALHTLVRYTPPLPLLQKLRVYVSHANFRVRAKSAVFISDCISKMGLEGMKEFGLGSLVQIAADSLKDRLPEARKSARCMVTSIYEAFTGDEEQKNPELSDMEIWQKICSTNLPPIQVQALVKIISS